MEISCPKCYGVYPIDPERIPEGGATPTCKKCGVAFTIVRATGDPVKDRAQRMKGYVLVREGRKEEPSNETEPRSMNSSGGTISARAILENRQFRLGACIAGVVLLILSGAFFLWKNQVHSRFEKTLRNNLAHASGGEFSPAFERVSFSFPGGLGREQGCIHGLYITNRATRERFDLSDKIHFEFSPSRKHFVTRPFDLRVNGKVSKSVIKGCVVEAEERKGVRLELSADEAFCLMNGVELFTVRGIGVSLPANGREWKKDRGFPPGEGVFGFRARGVEVWSEAAARDVDILVSIKNRSFAEDREAGDASPVNHVDAVSTEWGEKGVVAALEHCTFQLLGSAVKAGGSLKFQNPLERSEGNLRVSVKNFSHIMKYIHRLNVGLFDGIVAALVTLDEKKAGAYSEGTDFLDLTLSYKDAKIKINGHEPHALLLHPASLRAEPNS